MGTLFIALATLAFAWVSSADVAAQEGGQPGDPMRIVILVDNSQTSFHALPAIRRGLQQLVNGLPPNHELMLVTTGGHMSIRVPPTRDYLEIQEAIGEINQVPSGGNAMIGSVQEIYERFLRTAERRYPMLVVVSSDAYDTSQRVNDKTANELLAGVRKTGVVVNAILLTSNAPSLIRDLTLEMIKRTGGAYESALTVTALPTKMKTMAGHIGQQYKKVSPDRVPREEFRRSTLPK